MNVLPSIQMKRKKEILQKKIQNQTSLHFFFFNILVNKRNDTSVPYLLCPYESKLYDFCRFFSVCKKY
jgi:hypothetical protein